jgi:hypothetical protein
LVYREFGALVRRTIEAWNPDRVIVGHGAFHLRSALALARKKLALSVATTVRSLRSSSRGALVVEVVARPLP